MIPMTGYQFTTKKAAMSKIFSQQYIDAFFSRGIARLTMFLALISLTIFTNIADSYATTGGKYGAGRTRSCDRTGDPGTLEFNPTYGGKDIEFTLSNPVCLAVIAKTYTKVITSIASMNGICGTGSTIPRVIPSPLLDSVDIGRAGTKAATTQNAACATAVFGASTSFYSALGDLAIIYGMALNTYKNTKICGFGWKNPNPQKYNFSSGGIEEQRNLEIQNRIRQYQQDPENFDQNLLGMNGLDQADKIYREWYYGGIEFEDDPAGTESTCGDPLRNGAPQRYYMRGNSAPNFNCERYIDPNNSSAMSQALGCCKKRSREYVCIEYGGLNNLSGSLIDSSAKFCRAGKICEIGGVLFSTKFINNDKMICAESYSLCPYNFTLSGGTEHCEMYRDGIQSSSGYWDIIDPEEIENGDCLSNSEIRNADCTYNDKAGKCKNYCQYLTHCVSTSSLSFNYKSSIGSPYFSTACLDFVGDSQNKSSYSSLRHFSLPIAQCMKETLENLFYNRAGHSMCDKINEIPDKDGVCLSGYANTIDGFEYKKGGQVKTKSFFKKIQDALRDFVRMMLIFAVTFFGIGILIGKINLANKKDSIIFLVKFSLVLYFSLGTAWQSQFFDGVYNASSDFAMIVFRINAGEEEIKRDGCQFGDITLPDGSIEDSGRNYPEGKKYLAIFDTLDCKLARYLGFGPEVSAANIAKIVLAGYFVGPIGIYFSMCIFIFGFFMLALTIRALHIFLSSVLGIVLMVLISPIIIPTILFEKTNNLFKGWIKQFLSFMLQPLLLFAYVAIFVTIMDATLVGSATFTGKSPNKKISCEKNCYFSDTGLISLKENGIESSDCTAANERFIDPMNDSVACLVNLEDFGSWPGLEWLGISIPILENILNGNVKQKILTLLKGALIMILLYGFMDEISGIASQIIGGASLPTSKADPLAMFSKVAGKPGFSLSEGFSVKGGAVNEASKRMSRGSLKLAQAAGSKALSKGKEAMRNMGSQGKQSGGENSSNESDQSSSDNSAKPSSGSGGDEQSSGK